MILVYSPQPGPRIRFLFSFLIGTLLGDEVSFTSDPGEFDAFAGPKINYSADPSAGGLFFEADGLLNEKEIRNREIIMLDDYRMPAFFPVQHELSALPFDAFAASFYLLTHYEEYLPYMRDEYGRFQAKDSLAWKNAFLDKPVVNMWAGLVAEALQQKWPAWKVGKREFRFISTIDVNAAWKYKRKGFFRTAAAVADAVAGGRLQSIADRLNVISGKMDDPFDTYRDQLGIHREYGLDAVYFILFAEYDNNDRNIPVSNKHFRVLIKSLADYYRIGIHTSYASLRSPDKLENEFKGLSGVINKEISMTRQHFHVLNMPLTYRQFVNMDVEHDYSMGYAVTPGFRAGVCDPFPFYDLDFEVETAMKIWPYAIVDKALEYGYEMETAFKPVIDSVKKVNGTLVTLWNNESLIKSRNNKQGLAAYEQMIRMILDR